MATDNMGVSKRFMKQTAVYWEASGVSDHGQPTYEAPVQIDCRWEGVTEEFIDSDGDRVLSRARLIVDRDIAMKSVLWLGVLVDVVDENDPRENDDAWEVRQFRKTPNKGAKKFHREVYL